MNTDAHEAEGDNHAGRAVEAVPRGRLLHVEDNVRIAQMIDMMLEDSGFAVTWADSAEAALIILSGGETFDLVLSDIVMPGMNGIALAGRIKTGWPDLPVILTTGYSDELARGTAAAYPVLPKPFTRGALLDHLCGALIGS